jgi:hypothetical protein
MEHDGHVLARLDDLVEVADAALAHGAGERAVSPDRVAALEKITAGEVGGGEIVMAGNGVQWQAEAGCHVRHEPGLAAARRALQEQRQALAPGELEEDALVSGWDVVGKFDGGLRHGVEKGLHRSILHDGMVRAGRPDAGRPGGAYSAGWRPCARRGAFSRPGTKTA